MTASEPEGRSGKPPEPARKWVLIVTVVIGLGAVACLVFALQRGRLDSGGPPADDGQSLESTGSTDVAPARVSAKSRVDRVEPRPPPLTAATISRPEPSARSRQLVQSLSELDPQKGDITPEKAASWQRNLGGLLQLGAEAIPALREFLQKHEDVRFDSGPDTNLLGEPTLRFAFLKLLLDLPGPENLELQEQVLRTSTDPDEIALLARQLEMQAPDKYRQIIVESVTAALEKTRNGKSPGRDTSPLLKILEQYGNTGVR